MSNINCLELEQEINRLSLAMMTRNRQIGMALMASLRIQLTHQELAGVVLISLERLMWTDTEALLWSVEHLIPGELMQEIHKLTSVAVYKQLIRQGFVPGVDLSVDAGGKLLVNSKAQAALLPR